MLFLVKSLCFRPMLGKAGSAFCLIKMTSNMDWISPMRPMTSAERSLKSLHCLPQIFEVPTMVSHMAKMRAAKFGGLILGFSYLSSPFSFQLSSKTRRNKTNKNIFILCFLMLSPSKPCLPKLPRLWIIAPPSGSPRGKPNTTAMRFLSAEWVTCNQIFKKQTCRQFQIVCVAFKESVMPVMNCWRHLNRSHLGTTEMLASELGSWDGSASRRDTRHTSKFSPFRVGLWQLGPLRLGPADEEATSQDNPTSEVWGA